MRVRGSHTHTRVYKLHPQLSDRLYLSRPPKPENDGQRPCSVGLERLAHISTRYPRENSYPSRNTTALRHTNGPEPYQGPRLTPPALNTLQGRDPHHTLPGCQRGNHGLQTRGHGCPRADHIISTGLSILSQQLSSASTQRWTSNSLMQRYKNSFTSSAICQGPSRGGGA